MFKEVPLRQRTKYYFLHYQVKYQIWMSIPLEDEDLYNWKGFYIHNISKQMQ